MFVIPLNQFRLDPSTVVRPFFVLRLARPVYLRTVFVWALPHSLCGGVFILPWSDMRALAVALVQSRVLIAQVLGYVHPLFFWVELAGQFHVAARLGVIFLLHHVGDEGASHSLVAGLQCHHYHQCLCVH